MMGNNLTYCIGCGAPLQTTDPKKIGYIPPNLLDKDEKICQRCFRIRHYNEVLPVEIAAEQFQHILTGIGEGNNLILFIVDVFDMVGSWLTELTKAIGKNRLWLILNKIDLLPESVNLEKISDTALRFAHEHGVRPEGIFPISANNNIGISELWEYLQQVKESSIYVIGATNVGKSSFVNQILRKVNIETVITTSQFPGTTLQKIVFSLDEKRKIIDTPGIINKHRYSEIIEPSELKLIVPKDELRPKIYQLNSGQSLFIGGLARIDFISGEKQPFVLYVSNRIKIHRTKLVNASELYQKHAGILLTPPAKANLAKLPRFQTHTFKIKEGNKIDIAISGLGWLNLLGTKATVQVKAPQGVGVYLRKALI